MTTIQNVITAPVTLGYAGKSAYQSYLETTEDDPPLSEAAWVESLQGEDGSDATVTTEAVAAAGAFMAEDAGPLVRKFSRSLIPGMRSWLSRPMGSFAMGIVTDSTGAGTWVAEFARFLHEAHPEISIDSFLWDYPNPRIKPYSTGTFVGTSGDRYIARGSDNVVVFTPFGASVAPAGDVDIRVKASLPDWTPAASVYLLTGTDGAKYWCSLSIQSSGKPILLWADTPSVTYNRTALSTTATGFVDGSTHWVRATLDINNGAGASTVTFYTSEDGYAWTPLGAPVVTASSMTMTNDFPTQVYSGDLSTGILAGVKLYDIQWRDGIDGYGRLMSPVLIDQWIPNISSRLIFGGSPTLKIYNGAQPGGPSSYWTEEYLKRALPLGVGIVVHSIGHNDLSLSSSSYAVVKATFDALKTRINNAVPGASLVFSSQNPASSTYLNAKHHNTLTANQLQIAAGYGLPIIDIYFQMMDDGFTDDWIQVDGIHPVGSTYTKWGQMFYDAIFPDYP